MNAIAAQPDWNQINTVARQAIIQTAQEMRQSVYSNTISATISAANGTINIAPRNVGLIKGFLIEMSVLAVVSTTSSTATLTQFGPANLLTQIQFNDLQNNIRIQTTGWHLNFVNSAKTNRVYGSAVTTDSPIKYGNNWTSIIQAPSTIVTAGAAVTSTLNMMWYVPLAYNDFDFRGAVYANVVNAVMNLQLIINPTAFVASGDATNAVYSGVAGALVNPTINVYQIYMDQLPVDKKGTPVLPPLDMSTIYELKQTFMTGMANAQDFPMPYSNFREFVSTVAVWNNGGTLNTGSDVNYWALQTANYTNVLKNDAAVQALYARQTIGDDFPKGVYYFDHRRKPISTIQYGNVNLILNPSAVQANGVVYLGYEDFAYVNQIVSAGSLPGA